VDKPFEPDNRKNPSRAVGERVYMEV